MNILITGSNGFIGGRIASRFVDEGRSVMGCGRSPQSERTIKYTQTDLSSEESCQKLLESIDIVIHCAGKAGVWGARAEYEKANIQVTQNLINACKKQGAKIFINISSPSIYFDYKDQFDLREDQSPNTFSNFYAETKFLAEEIVKEANSESLKTISLRPRGVIGAGDKNWLPRIIKMRQEGSLVQPGNGENLVDFTSVENLIDAVSLCLTTEEKNYGRTFNITNGEPQKLWSFIDEALTQVGLDGTRKKVPGPIALGASRLLKTYHLLRNTKVEPKILPIKVGVAYFSMTLNIEDAKTMLGYKPRVTTKEALIEFSDWWRKLEKTI